MILCFKTNTVFLILHQYLIAGLWTKTILIQEQTSQEGQWFLSRKVSPCWIEGALSLICTCFAVSLDENKMQIVNQKLEWEGSSGKTMCGADSRYFRPRALLGRVTMHAIVLVMNSIHTQPDPNSKITQAPVSIQKLELLGSIVSRLASVQRYAVVVRCNCSAYGCGGPGHTDSMSAVAGTVQCL